jgi:molecular chaperone DnaK (HSP70)
MIAVWRSANRDLTRVQFRCDLPLLRRGDEDRSATRSIIAHTRPVKPKTFNDMEEAVRAMKEQDSRRDSIFRQSMEAQKHASELLEKKFQEAVKKAKETPDTGRPIRDFDLD